MNFALGEIIIGEEVRLVTFFYSVKTHPII